MTFSLLLAARLLAFLAHVVYSICDEVLKDFGLREVLDGAWHFDQQVKHLQESDSDLLRDMSVEEDGSLEPEVEV